MDQTTYQVRLESWKSIVDRCQTRPKGQSARQWLAENNISDKQYYYWLRKIRAQAYGEMQNVLPSLPDTNTNAVAFAEISPEQLLPAEPAPAVVIKTRKSTIEISSSISEAMIVRIIKAVSHAL